MQIHRLFSALLLCSASATAGELYTVDQSGGTGADFTELDQALGSVPAGSTLIVGAGSYTMTDPLTRGMEIIADPALARAPRIEGDSGLASTVHSVPEGEFVLLRGFELGAIEIFDTLGQIWLEGCDVAGAAISLRIHNCPSVTLRGCTIASGLDAFGDPSQPLYITGGSSVQVFDTRSRAVAGGDLGSGGCVHRPAVVVRHFSSLYAADCEFHGSGCGAEGSSPGLRAHEQSIVRLRNTLSEAGLGTPQAPHVELLSGATLEEQPDVPRDVTSPALAPSGASVPLVIRGGPGEQALLLVAAAPAGSYQDALFSIFAVARPWVIGANVTLDERGVAEPQLSVSAGAAALAYFLQPAFLDPGQRQGALGSPTAVRVVP